MTEKAKNKQLSVHDIALVGMMTAVIEVCKAALGFLPNVELTSLWIILFTLCFGKKILFTVPVFILIEGAIYGFGVWWVMYLYVWPILALAVWLNRRQESPLFWSILSGIFGLSFGFLCSLPYAAIGAADGGIRSGLYAGFTWWIAGIPWDIVHGISNFILTLILYRPVRKMLQNLEHLR